MADLQVIYDSNLEVAAIIDLDRRCGFGPAMVGPNAADVLTAFLSAFPGDLSVLDTFTAVRVFDSFLESAGLLAAATDGTPDNAPVDVGDGGAMDSGTVPTTAEGAPTDEPPPPAPADTDSTPTATETTQVITCPNCTGTGMVDVSGSGQASSCGMCRGSGKLTVPLQA